MSWKDDGDRSPTSAYGRSRWVVERIGACRKWDPAVFAELDAELGRLLAQEQTAVSPPDIPAQRNAKSDDGADDAGRLVKAAIDMRLQDRGPVPEAVSSLIYEGWQKVLLAAYRHDGTGGARWQDAMVTIDRLVWSVQPKVSDEDRRELLRSIPELLRTLRQSLSEVSLEQQRLALWLKELQALHTMALRGPRRGQADDRPPIGAEVKPPAPSPAHETDRMDPPESNRAAALSPPFGLATGAWVEIRDDDGQLTRAKLAWRSPQSDVWLFVDRQGRKALELSGSDIHNLLRQGILTILDDTPIVDRAIRDMVKTLKRDRKV